MKILIDGHMLGSGEGGNERYIANLIQMAKEKAELVVLVRDKEKSKDVTKGCKVVESKSSDWWRYLIELPVVAWREKVEVVHTTYYVAPLLFLRSVVMVHDMAFWRKPEYFSIPEKLKFNLVKYSVKAARRVVVPSEFTKRELVEYEPDAAVKVRVIHNVADPIFKKIEANEKRKVRERWKLKGKVFITFAGKYRKRKPEIFARALAKVLPDATLIVIGCRENEKGLYKMHSKTIFANDLDDKELNSLINIAEALLYHSEYEGFGLPVLEAMEIGVPVVASDIPAIREVGGEAPLYFENGNMTQLSEIFRRDLRMGRREHVKKGLARVKVVGGSKSLKKVIDVWREAGGGV